MELRLLEYYLAIVREGNISKAAEALHVTQPTLSRQMTQLEEELGTTLFQRGKKIVLTDAGRMLERRAEEIVSLVDEMEEEISHPDDIEGVISIGSGGLSASKVLTECMGGFRKLHPKVQFLLYTNSADYVSDQLDKGLLDFGLLLEPVDISKFDYIRMKDRERWGLLLRKSHPLAQKEYVTREDLWNETLITSNRLPVQKELLNWLGKPANELDIMATFNLITQGISIVESGFASALTLEGSVDTLSRDRFAFRPLDPELDMTTVFAWKKELRGYGAAGAFLQYFRKYAFHE